MFFCLLIKKLILELQKSPKWRAQGPKIEAWGTKKEVWKLGGFLTWKSHQNELKMAPFWRPWAYHGLLRGPLGPSGVPKQDPCVIFIKINREVYLLILIQWLTFENESEWLLPVICIVRFLKLFEYVTIKNVNLWRLVFCFTFWLLLNSLKDEF